MIVLNDSFKVKFKYKTYVTIGSFDGLHKGHLSLIDKTIQLSKSNNVKSMVNTFKEHPLNTINKDIAPKLIMDNETKIQLLEDYGLDVLNLCDFSDIMKMSPEDYVVNMIKAYNIKGIITGFNHKFGYKNQGDVELLKKLSEKYGIELYIVEPVKVNGEIVSSTSIRKYVANGEIARANSMLLRPYSLKGTVVHGREVGRTLGFPTANLKYDSNFVVPAVGVYYTVVEYNGKMYKAITDVGYAPTVRNSDFSVESYMLNFNEDIYGKSIKVNFIEKIRNEVKFDSLVGLRHQLESDKKFAESKDLENNFSKK
ncbi:bifunctional riboflavin kinase/FAD synthetase [Clostridium neuense]|uniref:Riboflavin biosynthesis protein n=1 Tax=Clostridium neuense TaxID=1728934 RepID=A0ABW8TDQ5_9CLOT